MLAPAGRVVCSTLGFTVKAPPEMLNSPISTELAPEFVIDTLRDAGVPTLTSPKSIAAGLIESLGAIWLADEKALEFDPQPASPVVIAMAAVASAMDQTVPRRLKLSFECVSSCQVITTLFLKEEGNIFRDSCIDITCGQGFLSNLFNRCKEACGLYAKDPSSCTG